MAINSESSAIAAVILFANSGPVMSAGLSAPGLTVKINLGGQQWKLIAIPSMLNAFATDSSILLASLLNPAELGSGTVFMANGI